VQGDDPVKNKITRNVSLDQRLVIYTFGPELVKGRHVKRQVMNEIDLRSIHRFEYFYEFHNRSVLLRIFGLIMFFASMYLAYANYAGIIHAYFPQLDPYWPYVYGAAAIFAVCGLSMVFQTDKVLVLQIRSGMEEKTDLLFYPTKDNELAIRYIAGRIHNR
jgi:hypothetical protein